MKTFCIGGALALALASTSLSAAPIHAPGGGTAAGASGAAHIWLAKGNNGKGNGNGGGNKKLLKKGQGHGGKGKPGGGNEQASNGNGKGNGQPAEGNDHAGNGKGKPEQAGGAKPKANGNAAKQASSGNGNNGKERRRISGAERDEIVKRIVSTPAPAGRDMARVLTATGLALATPQLVYSDTPEDELIRYSNCPPGLAKKDPPCVPPGLARDGVTYDEWLSYDRERYDDIWVERRDDWLGYDREIDPDPDRLLLRSDQIAELFDLDPAPQGQRYALIDGLPVLLDDDDYRSLMLVNQMARATDLMDGTRIAPTAALTQNELIDLYRLPQLGADQNYAVLNGELVQLNDEEYELLQMLRIARAVL